MLERFGYKPTIDRQLQEQYETALNKVDRWKGGTWRKDVIETNSQHVFRMFEILEDVETACPFLNKDIDMPTVQNIIYIHDAGEIIVGDLTHEREDYDSVHDQWKRKEYQAFLWIARNFLPQETSKKAVKLYKRYITQDETDKEALLANLIDKLQGSRFGFANVFWGTKMKPAQREMRFNHCFELIISPAKSLLPIISKENQANLKTFLSQELERFSNCGYKKEADLYIRNLDAILAKQ